VANSKSQIKRNRQNDKKRLRNRVFRGTARIAVRTARTNIDEGTPESKAALMQAISNLDRAAAHGVIHKNNAARRKSRMVKAFAKMVPVPVAAMAAEGEPMLAAEPAPKKKASSRRTARKVEEPVTAAAAAVDESKTPKTKKTAAAPKAKKADAKKPAAKTTAKKKTAATKES
jgi:small subunit ribosomal protein S20